jgi:dUTPase
MILEIITDGERITLMFVSKDGFAELLEVKKLASTDRVSGGFGRTDNNKFS